MKTPQDFPIETVAEWLVIATFGLVPAARERIKLEIEAHFADIVTARIADGMTKQDAESAALLELGEASSAAKEFRKNHLTEDEKKRIEEWVESGRSRMVFSRIYSYLIFIMVAFQFWVLTEFHPGASPLQWAGFFWCLVILCLVQLIDHRHQRFFRQRLTGAELIRAFIRLQIWDASMQLVMVASACAINNRSSDFALMTIPVVGAAAWIFEKRFILRKLAKRGAPEYFEAAP